MCKFDAEDVVPMGSKFSRNKNQLCGTKGIKIWTNIKMQTGIKYIPALGSFMVRDYLKQTVHLRKNTNVRNAAEK